MPDIPAEAMLRLEDLRGAMLTALGKHGFEKNMLTQRGEHGTRPISNQ